jgi:hypothetical protein
LVAQAKACGYRQMVGRAHLTLSGQKRDVREFQGAA